MLVGLEESEGSVLCLYDLGLSRVVKAVVIPGRVSYTSGSPIPFTARDGLLNQDNYSVDK